jgi:hypothetical protein
MEKASPPRKRSDSAFLLRGDERRGRVVRMLVIDHRSLWQGDVNCVFVRRYLQMADGQTPDLNAEDDS